MDPYPAMRPEAALTTDISLDTIRALITDDMAAVDRLIQQRLHSEVVLVNQVGHYIVSSGGKRLRPILVLLSAHACNYTGTQHIDLSAIIEFIHTATLIHDDVVDASTMRRGKDTANAIWGNETSVLVGDFLYSRAFEMMVDVGQMRVMEIMAHATNVIAEGEIMQLLNCNDADTTVERYLHVIHCKTAKLFESAARLGAVLAERSEQDEQALADYGKHLGTAFQLIDDTLDYSATSEQLGKNIGDDLAEGKPTLPLLYAMAQGNAEQRQILRQAIETGGIEHIDKVLDAIESTQALAYTALAAQQEADKAAAAIQSLPASQYKEAMIALTQFAVHRSF
jgi:octaprenyl-diphosphate synthase